MFLPMEFQAFLVYDVAHTSIVSGRDNDEFSALFRKQSVRNKGQLSKLSKPNSEACGYSCGTMMWSYWIHKRTHKNSQEEVSP